MNQDESVAMQQQEERLEQALERLDKGDFLSDDDVSIIRWACGKSKPNKNKQMTALFQDWATIFRTNGAI